MLRSLIVPHNTPGESATVVTAKEGNLMAKNGRAGAALATSAIGSFVAGTLATVLLTFFAPLVAESACAWVRRNISR